MEAIFVIIVFLLAIYFLIKGKPPKKRGLKARATAKKINFIGQYQQQPVKTKKRYPRPGISRSLIVLSQKFR